MRLRIMSLRRAPGGPCSCEETLSYSVACAPTKVVSPGRGISGCALAPHGV